jgi:hypothetical protein
MDATDFNQYNSSPLHPEAFRLPAIKELSMKVVKFTPPKFEYLKSHLEKYREALEITIFTEAPIPARAATPVLYIGNAKVSYYTAGKRDNEYHFYAFEWKKMPDSPIGWGWDNDKPEMIQKTKFYYRKEEHK